MTVQKLYWMNDEEYRDLCLPFSRFEEYAKNNSSSQETKDFAQGNFILFFAATNLRGLYPTTQKIAIRSNCYNDSPNI